MCNHHHHHSGHAVSRRNFLKFMGMTAGAPVVELIASIVPETVTPVVTALAQGEFADTILVNGKLITMGALDQVATALAVKDGLILQVGSDAEINALAGAATQIIDLQGKTVTPGFIDAHNHLMSYGTLLSKYEAMVPPEITTLDQLLAKVQTTIANKPVGEWVQGYFWPPDAMPTRRELDPISPDNPVWLMQQGGHFGVANSVALQIANITAETPDPDGGVIERDASGEPTGVLYNHRAMDLLRAHAPIATSEELFQSLHIAEDMMIAAGLTTYHDCNARYRNMEAYVQAFEQQAARLRGEVFYTVEWPRDVLTALDEFTYFSDDFMRFAGFKFLIDGQFPTWFTRSPHPGIRWDMPTWDPAMFKEAVLRLHDTGLQVSVHCGGDASFDLALDAFEAAMNANPRPDPRHRIEHAMLTWPDSIQRAADLGVQISCQPQFLRFLMHPEDLGAERAGRLVATRDWLDAGINVALGSDAPSTPWHAPNVTLIGALLRPDGSMKPHHPEQALTIQEALHAHTMGSAHAAFEENVKGSLEPGKFADLVVWSGDFYAINQPMDIAQIGAQLTMINGEIVHQA